MPGCVATCEITDRGYAETSAIRFALKDCGLARQHRAEVEGQIMEGLSAPVSKSDMER